MRSSWYYLLVEGIEVEVEVEVEVEAEVEVEYTRGEVEVEVCRSRWNGCCVLILIVFCKSLLAIEFKLLRHGCGLNVRICAKQPVFSGKRSFFAEKRWLSRATVSGVVLPSNLSRSARAV